MVDTAKAMVNGHSDKPSAPRSFSPNLENGADRPTEADLSKLLELERARLEVEKERIALRSQEEKAGLDLERQRLAQEKERLALERERLALKALRLQHGSDGDSGSLPGTQAECDHDLVRTHGRDAGSAKSGGDASSVATPKDLTMPGTKAAQHVVVGAEEAPVGLGALLFDAFTAVTADLRAQHALTQESTKVARQALKETRDLRAELAGLVRVQQDIKDAQQKDRLLEQRGELFKAWLEVRGAEVAPAGLSGRSIAMAVRSIRFDRGLTRGGGAGAGAPNGKSGGNGRGEGSGEDGNSFALGLSLHLRTIRRICPLSLRTLALTRCDLRAAGVHHLGPELVQLQHLHLLDVSHNYALGNDGAEALLQYLPSMRSLEVLKAAEADISYDWCNALRTQLPHVAIS